ncbi:MAG TPA: precorrin-2 C(20)-methyltransferase [Alphaproteobacteria bacterium]
MSAVGTLYGLGVGPGDPELLTLKALRIIRAAPVIAYPAPEHGASFARAIVSRYLSPAKCEIPIRIPMVSARYPAQEIYEKAAAKIDEFLVRGEDVAVLCEGDPFFYGSFMYLFGRLAEHRKTEVVPGVSSLVACACAAHLPLAARNDALTVIPAPLAEEALAARLEDVEAAAIIKLSRHFTKVRRVLDRLGLSGNARYIEHASLASQRILSLDAVCEADVPYFSMILVHRRGQAWR